MLYKGKRHLCEVTFFIAVKSLLKKSPGYHIVITVVFQRIIKLILANKITFYIFLNVAFLGHLEK